MKTIVKDIFHINVPVGGSLALITIADLKDIAVIFSVLVGAFCTIAITIWKIKRGKIEED